MADTLLDRRGPGGELILDEMRLSADDLRAIDKVFIVACGSSYHAALVAKYAIEHWVKLPTEVDIASEFRYRDPVLNERTLCVGVSQSGETLDTSEAMREAKRLGAKVLVVSNVVDSSMARAADGVLYTRAGPEIGVASTKCHLAQIVALEVLGLYLAQILGTLPASEINEILDAMEDLPRLVSGALERAGDVDDVAAKLTDARDFFFLGRHVGFPVALEGALEAEGAGLPARRGLPGGRAQARADRADRAGDRGRGDRHAQPAVGEDAVQHRGGAQPRGHGRAAGRRRRRGVGRRGGSRAVGPADRPRSSLPSWAWCRCSSWPTGWPACTATIPTAPGTWPRR